LFEEIVHAKAEVALLDRVCFVGSVLFGGKRK
jgi:hypothetical protein